MSHDKGKKHTGQLRLLGVRVQDLLLGIALGAGIGVAIDNLAVGLGVGVAIGLFLDIGKWMRAGGGHKDKGPAPGDKPGPER